MLTEAILLGNVAIRAGKKLEFDAAKLRVPELQGGDPVHQAGVPQGLGAVGTGMKSGVRSQESGVRSQGSGVRGQGSGVRKRIRGATVANCNVALCLSR